MPVDKFDKKNDLLGVGGGAYDGNVKSGENILGETVSKVLNLFFSKGECSFIPSFRD